MFILMVGVGTGSLSFAEREVSIHVATAAFGSGALWMACSGFCVRVVFCIFELKTHTEVGIEFLSCFQLGYVTSSKKPIQCAVWRTTGRGDCFGSHIEINMIQYECLCSSLHFSRFSIGFSDVQTFHGQLGQVEAN